jgi:hypothetical protein
VNIAFLEISVQRFEEEYGQNSAFGELHVRSFGQESQCGNNGYCITVNIALLRFTFGHLKKDQWGGG